jgi:hypothetical protein
VQKVCLLLFIAVPLFAQNAVIRGQVADESGAAVPQARITVAGPHTNRTATADDRGSYVLTGLAPERSRNGYGSGGNREVWAYDRHTGQERFVWRTSREYGLDLNGVTANGGLLARVGAELHSLMRNLWMIDNVDEAAVSPDGRRLALVIAESYDKLIKT